MRRTKASLPQAMQRLVDFLGELGPRWGLPRDPCRVHGYLYLRARPASEDEIRAALGLGDADWADALTWLKDYRLVEPAPDGMWRTGSDPWELMMRALDERRRREAGPALETLRECRRLALSERPSDPLLRGQIDKLLSLAEDLEAIDAQTRRLSPTALRRLVGVGAGAARLLRVFDSRGT
jgi:DNA-binding transcriptional regulator GbsR (MarR family)